MKICLINPPVNQHYAPLDIPLQLLILATISREVEWNPHILDFNLLTKSNPHFPLSHRFFSSATNHIQTYEPDILGITCLGSSIPFALEIARRYKQKCPACKILLGGPQATLLHDIILKRYPFIDIVCRGEGEITLKEVLIKSNDLKSVEGISYRDSSDKIFINPKREMLQNLDRTPIPDYELMNLTEYRRIYPAISLHIEAGRGCPYACSYCSTSLVWERNFRLKSPHRLLSETTRTVEKTGIRNIHFIHDLFTLDNDWVLQVCEALSSMGIKISWGCDARVDSVTPRLLRKMADSGCNYIFFGVESGSKSMQQKIKKNIDLDHSIEIIKESIECGIMPTASFILGYPSESLEELNETFEYVMLLLVLKVPGIVINTFNPEYGTESYHLCKDKLEVNWYMLKRDLPFVTEDVIQLIKSNPEVFSHFYYPKEQQYDFQILIELLSVLPIIPFLKALINIQFYLPDLKPIDIFLDLYRFVKTAMRFDEYHNVRYNALKLYGGLLSYMEYLREKYDIKLKKNLVHKDKISQMTKILNDHNTMRGFNVQSKIDKDRQKYNLEKNC